MTHEEKQKEIERLEAELARVRTIPFADTGEVSA